ncbi:MAG TPA: hypothetical protein PLD47_06010 [Aggregatilineales bacterium]|nr:hypothetical protein [Aggregatilineales bacterium]
MVDSPAYHNILTDGLGGGDLKGKRTTPALLVRVAEQEEFRRL